MNCPRCSVMLAPFQIDAAGVAVNALRCQTCTGTWLEQEDLRRVEQSVDIRLLDWRHLPGVDTNTRLLFCPRCAGPPRMLMDKVVSSRDKRVVMDVCGQCHGVWLNHGELEAIQQKGLMAALADVLKFIAKSG
ncbi:MAG TPA: zf-TFIIB domain-containing protein [Myxococcales bacterium]|jgi:Zn-finger nucleic acid-binding protein|nr:zf-TFIIB domain-containing protein [Myxococcales bacterium]